MNYRIGNLLRRMPKELRFIIERSPFITATRTLTLHLGQLNPNNWALVFKAIDKLNNNGKRRFALNNVECCCCFIDETQMILVLCLV